MSVHLLDRYLLKPFFGGRWIIVNAARHDLAWSGSRWVPVSGGLQQGPMPTGGYVQVCNFETPNGAHFYATSIGLVPAEPEGSVA